MVKLEVDNMDKILVKDRDKFLSERKRVGKKDTKKRNFTNVQYVHHL